MLIIGLDTGPVHCGMAILLSDTGKCVCYAEVTPQKMYSFLEKLNWVSLIAIEKFQLWPKAGQFKMWSQIPEAEIIGVVKYIAGRRQIRLVEVQPAAHKAHKQNYDFKKLGITNAHAQDAYSIATWAFKFKLKGLTPADQRTCEQPQNQNPQ